jgi:carboxypeptidase Taq
LEFMTALHELKRQLADVTELRKVSAILGWDQSTYMPPGGADARGRQLAVVDRIAHEKFTTAEVGKLIDKAEAEVAVTGAHEIDRAFVRVARRDYEQSCKIPAQLVTDRSEHFAKVFNLWTKARPANDFKAIEKDIQRSIELSKRTAECFPGYKHIIDPLIDFSDPGMTADVVAKLFKELSAELVPLVKAVCSKPKVDSSFLNRRFPVAAQWDFGLEIAKAFGYDLSRGRQDRSAHPFMTSFGIGDIRITTRFKEDDIGDGLFSTLHETGHALYEQGNAIELDGNILQGGISSGVHESQSRLWENVVARSKRFWRFYYPKLQGVFSEQLGKVSLEEFYRAINKVERSLIRVDADELTYNLHVIIRFELEMQLLEGKVAVKELPEAWRAAYTEALGVCSKDDKDGVLQDCHWYGGQIGGCFQGYTIGNILSVQFFDAAVLASPAILTEIEQGNFTSLHAWLSKNIYRHGRAKEAPELIKGATGSDISIKPYIKYLKDKYGEIYGV